MSPPSPPTSIIDSTLTPLDDGSAGTSGAHNGWTVLGVKIQQQCHTNWCWAAVAASIAKFYNSKTDCSQCVIAITRLDDPACCDAECGTKDDAEYNVPSTLQSTLGICGCDNGVYPEPDVAPPIEDVQNQLIAGHPVCVRVVWTEDDYSGNGHFVVIDGFEPGTGQLYVLDPLGPEERDISYHELSFNYPPHTGVWVDTYYTKPSVQSCAGA